MSRPPRRLDGKVVVVTGAARGVGAELSRRLTSRGARVALLGLEPARLAAVSEECPGSAWWLVDVTSGDQLGRVAAEVEARFGGVDVVVANAGIAAGGPLALADPVVYDRVVEVNLLGSIRTVRAFLPSVLERRGYALQVASLAALLPAPLMSAYCASKSGVEAFAHALRPELAAHGAAVGVAYLSWTETDMVRGADRTPGLGELRRRMPGVLGRTWPLGPAVDRIADGIAARRSYVYAQPFLRYVQPLRGLAPFVLSSSLLARAAAVGVDIGAAERTIVAAGPAATQLVGAGGAADDAARTAARTNDREEHHP